MPVHVVDLTSSPSSPRGRTVLKAAAIDPGIGLLRAIDMVDHTELREIVTTLCIKYISAANYVKKKLLAPRKVVNDDGDASTQCSRKGSEQL